MAALKKYDPRDVTITWDGIVLNSGIASGTFISVARVERSASLNVGGDGRGTMVINPNRSSMVRLRLRAGSDVNDELADVISLDESDPSQKRVGTLEISDFNGRTLHIDEEAFLDGPPDDEFGTEEGDNEYAFVCPNMEMQRRGSNSAA